MGTSRWFTIIFCIVISHQLTSNLISALFNNVKNSSLQLSYDSSSILSRRSSLSQPFVSPSRSFIQSIIQPLKPRQSIKSIFKSLIPSPTFDPSRWKSSFYFVHPQIKDKSSFPSVKSIFKKLTGAESIQRPVALPAPNVFGVQPELYAQLPPNYQYANVQPEQQPEQLQQQQQQQYVQQVHPQQQYETQYTQQQNQQQKPYDQQQYQQQTEQQQFIQQFEQQIPLQQMQQVQYQYEQQQQQQPYQQQQYQVEQVQQVQQQQIQPQTVQQLGPHQPLYQIHPQVYQSNGNSIGNSNQMTQYGFKPIHSSSGAAKQAPKQQINTQGSNGPGISLSMGGSNDGYSSSKSAAPQSGFSISLGSGENAPGMTISLGSGNEANQASASNQQGYSTGGYSSGSYSGGYSGGPGVSISMGGGGGGSGMSVSLGSGGDSYGSGESGAGAMSFSLGGANNYDSGSGMQVQFGGEPNYQGQSYNYAPSSSNSYSQGTSSYGQEGSYGSNSYGSNSYGNNYNYNNVNKNIYKYYDDKPIMSIQMPAKGKTLIEANLKIPPIKMKINSSPRVKITAGTTDPLEKPHEDEETIMEDIFKPPKPFEKAPRKNTTSDEDGLNGNKTITDDGTHNGTITDDFHPQYLPYPPPYPSSYYQGYVPEGYYDGNPQEISLLTHQSYSNTNTNEIDHSKSYTKQTSHQQYGYDTNKASSSSSLPSIQTQTNQNQISQPTVNRKPQISFIPITHQPQAQPQPRPSSTHRYSDLQTSGSSQHDIYVKSNTKQRRQDNPVVQKKMQKVPQSSNNVPYYNSNSPVQYSQSYHNGQPVSNQQAQDDHPNNGKHYYGTQGTGAGYKYYNQGHYDMFNNQYQKQYEYQQQKARHYQNLYGYNVPNYNNQPYKPYQQPYYNKYYKKDPNYSPSGFHNGSLDYEQSKKFGKMFEQYGPGIKSNEKAQVILDIRPRISFKFHNKSEPMEKHHKDPFFKTMFTAIFVNDTTTAAPYDYGYGYGYGYEKKSTTTTKKPTTTTTRRTTTSTTFAPDEDDETTTAGNGDDDENGNGESTTSTEAPNGSSTTEGSSPDDEDENGDEDGDRESTTPSTSTTTSTTESPERDNEEERENGEENEDTNGETEGNGEKESEKEKESTSSTTEKSEDETEKESEESDKKDEDEEDKVTVTSEEEGKKEPESRNKEEDDEQSEDEDDNAKIKGKAKECKRNGKKSKECKEETKSNRKGSNGKKDRNGKRKEIFDEEDEGKSDEDNNVRIHARKNKKQESFQPPPHAMSVSVSNSTVLRLTSQVLRVHKTLNSKGKTSSSTSTTKSPKINIVRSLEELKETQHDPNNPPIYVVLLPNQIGDKKKRSVLII